MGGRRQGDNGLFRGEAGHSVPPVEAPIGTAGQVPSVTSVEALIVVAGQVDPSVPSTAAAAMGKDYMGSRAARIKMAHLLPCLP